jgi:ribonucleotide reductase alpha subunit
MWRDYIAAVTFEIIRSSCNLAKETGVTFDGFHGSNWQSGETIDTMIHALDEGLSTSEASLLDPLHTKQDWIKLRDDVSSMACSTKTFRLSRRLALSLCE